MEIKPYSAYWAEQTEMKLRKMYGIITAKKSKTGERYPVLDSIRGNYMVIL